METFGLINPEKYVPGTLIIDVVIGAASVVPIFIAALALGGSASYSLGSSLFHL
jgi:hypothetical protein